MSTKPIEERLYSETTSLKLAMEQPLRSNLPRLRDHLQLTEVQAAELGKKHTDFFDGLIPSHLAGDIHDVLTQHLTRPAGLSEADVNEDLRRRENERVTTHKRLREEWSTAALGFDRVFAK